MKSKTIAGLFAAGIIIVGGIVAYNLPAASKTVTPPAASGTYSMFDVSAHNSASSCWTAIAGGVYDLTDWIGQHPGGSQAILSLCGIDGTAAFDAQHGGQKQPENELASLKIGTLVQ